MLDPHGQANEAVLQAGGAARLGRDRRVGHGRRRLHQRLHAPERLGQREHPRAHGEGLARRDAARELEAHHAPGGPHLPRAERVLRVLLEPRVVDALHLGRGREVRGHRGRVGAVAVHPHGQRLDAAQHEEAVHRTRGPADRVLVEGQLLADLGVTGDQRAPDHVGVSPEVLRQGVEHDVRAEAEGLLQVRRREGVVDDAQRARSVGQLRSGSDVGEAQERVAGRLEVHVPRALGEGRLDLLQVGRVHEAELDAIALEHAREEPPGPAVEVVARDHVVPRLEAVEEGVAGRESARERQPASALLQGGEVGLEGRPRRVARAAVLVVADRLGGGRLRIGARHVDGRHDRPGHGLRLLAGVDREGLEASVLVDGHGGVGEVGRCSGPRWGTRGV